MAARFVEDQHAWPSIERPGEDQPLALPTGQRRTEIHDARVVAQRHAHDFLVDLREPARTDHVRAGEIRFEECDVLRDRAVEQLVVLEDACHRSPEVVIVDGIERDAIDGHSTASGHQETEEQFRQRGLARPRRALDRDALAIADVEIDTVEDPRAVGIVAKRQVAHVDPVIVSGRNGACPWIPAVVGDDIAKARVVQSKGAPFGGQVHQMRGADRELRRIGQVRDEHAWAELATHDQQRGGGDRTDPVQAENELAYVIDDHRPALDHHGRARRVAGATGVSGELDRFGARGLDRVDTMQHLQQQALLGGLRMDVALHGLEIMRQGDGAQDAVDQRESQRERHQHWRIEADDDQRKDGGEAVERTFDETVRDDALDFLDGGEARMDIADRPLDEERVRKAQEPGAYCRIPADRQAFAQGHQQIRPAKRKQRVEAGYRDEAAG